VLFILSIFTVASFCLDAETSLSWRAKALKYMGNYIMMATSIAAAVAVSYPASSSPPPALDVPLVENEGHPSLTDLEPLDLSRPMDSAQRDSDHSGLATREVLSDQGSIVFAFMRGPASRCSTMSSDSESSISLGHGQGQPNKGLGPKLAVIMAQLQLNSEKRPDVSNIPLGRPALSC
jgi:hypothetical protein